MRKKRQRSNLDIYHVVMRGNDRQDIFIDDEDRNKSLKLFLSYIEEYNFSSLSHCLMDNHIHLVLKVKFELLSDAMNRLNQKFVIWYNNKYDRCGNLFQDRFGSEPANDEKTLLKMVRYVHNNPVKLGLVKSPEEYKWSSISHCFGGVGFTETEEVFKALQKVLRTDDFISFSLEKNNDDFLENVLKRRTRSDEEVRNEINNEFEIDFCKKMHFLNKAKRDSALLMLIQKGYPINQLSRITRFSRGLITRVLQNSTGSPGVAGSPGVDAPLPSSPCAPY